MNSVEDRQSATIPSSTRPGMRPSSEARDRFEQGLEAARRTMAASPRRDGKPQGAPEGVRMSAPRETNRQLASQADGLLGEAETADAAEAALMGRKQGPGEQRAALVGRRSHEDPEDEMASLAMATSGAPTRPTDVPTVIIASRLDPQQAAQLERMAAAIAEVRGNVDAIVRVDFPPSLTDGSALATGAVLARDAATGALSIRIVGLNPAVGEGRRAVLETELRQKLDRRRVRLRELVFERGR